MLADAVGRYRPGILVCAMLAAMGLLATGTSDRALRAAPASVLTVTSTNDLDDGVCSAYPGHCSLREALNAADAAPGSDTIDFHPTVSGAITLGGPLPHLTGQVVVSGPGAGALAIDASGVGSVLWVDAGAVATISGLTLRGGIGSGNGGTAGGGVVNRGTLTLTAMVITQNSAQYGAGVFDDIGSKLTLTDSTISSNVAADFGGAVYSAGPGGTLVVVTGSTLSGNSSGSGAINAPAGTSLTITNSTISGNTATQNGGVAGVLGGANVHIAFSTIVSNTGIGVFSSYLRSTIVDSCGTAGGAPGSQGHNLAPSSACFAAPGPADIFNPSFNLGPLAANGGPTQTHALLVGSPAIDAGDPANCPATDQRGLLRPAGAACDIGAYEYRAVAPPTPTAVPSPTAGCVPPPAGMVAWYPLNETPGSTTVTDVWGGHMGLAQPGPIGGPPGPSVGPIWGPSAPSVVPPFMVVGSLYFWEGQRLIDVPHSPALDIGAGSFAIDGWVWSATHVPGNTVDYMSPIVDKFDASASLGYGLYVRHGLSGVDALTFVYGDGSTVRSVGSTTPPAQAAWVHVAATVERLMNGQLDVRLYENGALAGQQVEPPPAGPIASTQSLHLGGTRLVPAVIGPTPYTEIGLDEIELFQRALSAAEVHALFAAGSFGKCRGDGVTSTPTPTRTPRSHWSAYLAGALVHGALQGGVPTAAPRTPTWTPRATQTPTVVPTALPTETATPTESIPTPSTTPTATSEATATAASATPTRATPTETETETGTPSATPTSTKEPAETPTAACAAQPPEMAAWWPLDEPAGTDVLDVVGGHDGQAAAGAEVLDPAEVAAGRSFDGIAGLITVPDDAALDPGEGDFSVDAWIRPDALGRQPVVTKQSAPADAPEGWALYLENGHVTLALSNGTSSVTAAADTFLAPDEEWHLLAASVERGSTTGGHLYLDGTLVHTFDPTGLVGAIRTGAALEMGHQPALGRGQPEHFYQGALDEVELFHGALSAADVGALYAAGSVGKCDKPKPISRTQTPIPKRAARATETWLHRGRGPSILGDPLRFSAALGARNAPDLPRIGRLPCLLE